MTGKRRDSATIERARELYATGATLNAVALEVGVSTATIFNWREKYGWPKRAHPQAVVNIKHEAYQMRRRGETVTSICERLSVKAPKVRKWIEDGGWDEEPRVESAAAVGAVDREAGKTRLEIISLHKAGQSIYEIAAQTAIPWPRVHLIVFDYKRTRVA